MNRKVFPILVVGGLLALSACGSKKNASSPGGFNTTAALPTTSAPASSPTQAPSNLIAVALGETDPMHMYIHLTGTTATAGKVTFVVTNEGKRKHEFVVLQTDTAAGDFPISSFEGEKDRFDEDAAGTNVGETGDMEPGDTKTLVIDMTAGHYVVACNLPGHYRMGMRQDFTVS